MQWERPLDADAERVLADGERLAGAGTLAFDRDPSNTWMRWRLPSITRKWTRTVSPALNCGTSRNWRRSMSWMMVLIARRPRRARPMVAQSSL
jgi:hypothetical protein